MSRYIHNLNLAKRKFNEKVQKSQRFELYIYFYRFYLKSPSEEKKKKRKTELVQILLKGSSFSI